MKDIRKTNIIKTNNLIKAACIVVSEILGVDVKKKGIMGVATEKIHGRKDIERKVLKGVIDELKQYLVAKNVKIVRYDQKMKGFQQNRLYTIDQKRFYIEINGECT